MDTLSDKDIISIYNNSTHNFPLSIAEAEKSSTSAILIFPDGRVTRVKYHPFKAADIALIASYGATKIIKCYASFGENFADEQKNLYSLIEEYIDQSFGIGKFDSFYFNDNDEYGENGINFCKDKIYFFIKGFGLPLPSKEVLLSSMSIRIEEIVERGNVLSEEQNELIKKLNRIYRTKDGIATKEILRVKTKFFVDDIKNCINTMKGDIVYNSMADDDPFKPKKFGYCKVYLNLEDIGRISKKARSNNPIFRIKKDGSERKKLDEIIIFIKKHKGKISSTRKFLIDYYTKISKYYDASCAIAERHNKREENTAQQTTT
jgi:hypothetical protein